MMNAFKEDCRTALTTFMISPEYQRLVYSELESSTVRTHLDDQAKIVSGVVGLRGNRARVISWDQS
jgi:hypothetical protein